MLPNRIEAVAPQMPQEIRRWFLERKHAIPSVQEQDWDLVLAEWEYLPLLIEYVEDSSNVLEKRFEAFSALMVLQSFEAGDSKRIAVTREIKRIVLANRDFAQEVCEWLGLVETFVVHKIFGAELPADVPQWIREEVERRLNVADR